MRKSRGFVPGERDVDGIEPERMRERNQVAGLLRGKDARDCAATNASPFGNVAARNASAAAGGSRTSAHARAVRFVTAFAPTSTIETEPSAATCEGGSTRGRRRLKAQPDQREHRQDEIQHRVLHVRLVVGEAERAREAAGFQWMQNRENSTQHEDAPRERWRNLSSHYFR